MEVVLQSHNTECGIACLAMISSHHGNHIGLRELRARHGASLKGITLARLIEVAGILGLNGRPVRVSLEHLDSLATPCVLHWDMNHFVVLERVTKKRAWIIDPAAGRKVYSLREISPHFSGVALELSPATGLVERPAAPAVRLSQITGRIGGIYSSLAQLLALSATLQIFSIVAPFFMQWVIDQVLVSGDGDLLAVLGLSFGMLVVINVLVAQLRGWSVIHLSNRLGLQWGRNIFSHLIKLPLDFFEKRHLGDIVSRLGSVQAIQRTLTTSFVEAIIDGTTSILTLSIMAFYSWKLALVSVAAVGLYIILRIAAYMPLKNGTEEQLTAGAKQQTHLLESLRGMPTLKVSGSQVVREASYHTLLNETTNKEIKVSRLRLFFGSGSQLIFGIERIVVIWLGASITLGGGFSVGMLIAYIAYKEQFAQRVSGLIDKCFELRMLRLHGERIADIVLTSPEQNSESTIDDIDELDASIEIQDISFRYGEAEPLVLDNCNLIVSAGESIAIVGPSGCGKTTLAKVILGLLEPNSGRICIGGKDIRRVGLNSYRRRIGAVMQDDRLFAGSIAENIAFGEEAIDEPRVIEAAELAAVHDDVLAMPMGYHSLIGDMGTVLSGGQKQRVLLARALYKKPSILILDEATSHLDVRRERLVNRSIKTMKLTTIVIAHRPETIASADRVVKMRRGSIMSAPPDSIENHLTISRRT